MPAFNFLVMIYLLIPFVIQSEAKNLENILADIFVYVTEILPPFGRLNDKIVSTSISFPNFFVISRKKMYLRCKISAFLHLWGRKIEKMQKR